MRRSEGEKVGATRMEVGGKIRDYGLRSRGQKNKKVGR